MNKQNIADKLNSPNQPHYNSPTEIEGREFANYCYKATIESMGPLVYINGRMFMAPILYQDFILARV